MTLPKCLFLTMLSASLGVGLFSLSTLAPAANAQQASINRALGNWIFQSAPYSNDTCQMSGKMQIRPDAKTGGLACAFTAIEACIDQKKWIIEQACSIAQNGDQIAKRSSIVNFIESDAVTDTYVPDHFILSIGSPTKMTGQLISAISATVELVRQEEDVS